ncbi:MAG: hypothetical protein HS126_24685 [Anaerolineales bacterium]|nr:hypothetical protein [Anaerolineales bacterium]
MFGRTQLGGLEQQALFDEAKVVLHDRTPLIHPLSGGQAQGTLTTD